MCGLSEFVQWTANKASVCLFVSGGEFVIVGMYKMFVCVWHKPRVHGTTSELIILIQQIQVCNNLFLSA